MTLHIAIPVMQELELLPATLMCIAQQSDAGEFRVYICVNQTDSWWNNPEKRNICEENQAVLALLKKEKRFPLTILDCASQGKGWDDKKSGVGQARKTLFDHILQISGENDIVISLDADTDFGVGYFSAVRKMFRKFPKHAGLMNPYYHRLTEHETLNRAILRYEMYMRCYALNLWRIGSPYYFTALGSAMAVRVGALKAVKSIDPYRSGEDFYLAQKLRKYGALLLWSPETVFPSARLSDRVQFGTGPALIKGVQNNWSAYPIYPPESFELLKETFELFPQLFHQDLPTPLDDFLTSQFSERDIWSPLRKNFKTESQFTRACHQKIDGLRTLQFLKSTHTQSDDNENLAKNFQFFFGKRIVDFDFQKSPVALLNALRNQLFEKEQEINKI